jgi:hypothetical protein
MNIPDHNSVSLEKIFGVKILKIFDADADADPGIFLTDRDLGCKKFGSWMYTGLTNQYFCLLIYNNMMNTQLAVSARAC